MWKDRIVESVRKTREKILKEANYDLEKVLNEIKLSQLNKKDRLISVPFKK